MDIIERGIKKIKETNSFDEKFYLKEYGNQVGDCKDLLNHYITIGYKEGKNPSADFDTLYYIKKYPDIEDMNPLIHYVLWGKREHRFASLNMELDYIEKGIISIKNQNLFDEEYYLSRYGKYIGGIDPLIHYISYGWKEGKNPSASFDNDFYIRKYRDTRKQNPLIHYALYGRKNGYFNLENQFHPDNDFNKAINIIKENNLFDSEYYLNRYDDVKQNRIDPVTHYLQFGYRENRKMSPNYDFTDYINKNALSKSINPFMHFILNEDFNDLKISKSLNEIITEDIEKYLESKFLVSVIMPTYNRRDVINNAIDSVINQSFKSWELIIIDDGSNDNTEDFIKERYAEYIENNKIIYIKTNNNGVSKARNIGLMECKGDIIAYLDSDNVWYDSYLEKMVYILDNYDYDSAYSAIKINDNVRNLIKVREVPFNRVNLLIENFIDLNIFVHKRELYDELGGFDENLTRLVDWDIILKYTKDNEPYFLNEILAEYYIDDSLKNISNTVNLRDNKEIINNKYAVERANRNVDALNIAYVLWDFPALSQTFVINELRWLVEKGYNVKVFYKIDPDKKAKIDFDLDYCKIKDEQDLENKLIEYNVSVIHTHFVYPAGTLLTYPIAERLKIPFTVFAHAIDIFLDNNIKRNKVDKLTRSKYCIKILTLGDYHYDFLVGQGVPNEKILLSRQATNYSIENPIKRSDSRFKRSIKNIIGIGRFVEKKGWDIFIDAANILKNEDFIFKIYGYGPLEDELKDKVKKLGLENVKFMGVLTGIDEVKNAYLEGDLFLSPNKIASNGDRDGMPTVLFEAMAYGIPLISTNLVTIPEFIIDNQSGFLIAPDDSKLLADKIIEVKNLSKDKLFSIVKYAQNVVQNLTSVEKTMNTLLRLWNNERIGIFMVTYNDDGNYKTIEKILDNIYRYTTTLFDLIIVDNNSHSKFKEFLNNYSIKKENMEVIFLEDNIFCGPASNIALNNLNNEFAFYICSNEGFVLKPGWEIDAVNLMKNNEKIAMAGNLVSSPSFFNANTYKSNKWFEKARNREYIDGDNEKPLKHVQGGCFIIRKEAFIQSGGFNPDLPQGHMDVEYSYFLESEGWELGQIPNWISLTKKTLPNVYSYMDQNTSIAHPLLLDDLPYINDIIFTYCNICGGILENDYCEKCNSDKLMRTIYRIVGKTDKVYRGLNCSFIMDYLSYPNEFNKMFNIVNKNINLDNYMDSNFVNTHVLVSNINFSIVNYTRILNKFLSVLNNEACLIIKLSEDIRINEKIEDFLIKNDFVVEYSKFDSPKLDNSKFLIANRLK